MMEGAVTKISMMRACWIRCIVGRERVDGEIGKWGAGQVDIGRWILNKLINMNKI